MPKDKPRIRRTVNAGHRHTHESQDRGKGKHEWLKPKRKEQRKK